MDYLGYVTHYGHKNICRGVTEWRNSVGDIPIESTRPFNTIEKMNQKIVDNINDVVNENDWLFHLGDWSFGGYENIKKFRDRIICKNIILVLGNHDHHIENNKGDVRDLFTHVFNYLTLYYDKREILLFHYPITSWNNMSRGSIHLHGHTHLPDNQKFSKGRRMDIGIDGNTKFKPYNLIDECILPLLSKPISSEQEFKDHHIDEFTRIRKK